MSYFLKILLLTALVILHGCATYSIDDSGSSESTSGATVEVLEQEHIEEIDLQAEEVLDEDDEAKRQRNKVENPDDDMQRLD